MSKLHVSTVITGSGVMTISFYKGLTKNPEIGNTAVWVLPNIWRLKRVSNTKFGKNVANKMLLNVAKCQGYNFYHFWVIKEKPTGGKMTLPPPSILGYFLTLCMKELKSEQSSLLNVKRKYSVTLHKKCLPLKISSVNVPKSAENYRFGHNYRRNP